MVRRKVDPPRGVLTTALANSQRFRHERYHPSPDLEQYVEHYWVVEWNLRGEPPVRVETLPHPSVHMIFERGGRSRIRGAARAKFSRLLKDDGGVFAVKFRPAGFHPFARVSVSRFTDAVVTPGDVFGASGDDLAQAVLAESGTFSRITIVESYAHVLQQSHNPARGTERLVHRKRWCAAADLEADGLHSQSEVTRRALMGIRSLPSAQRSHACATPGGRVDVS